MYTLLYLLMYIHGKYVVVKVSVLSEFVYVVSWSVWSTWLSVGICVCHVLYCLLLPRLSYYLIILLGLTPALDNYSPFLFPSCFCNIK